MRTVPARQPQGAADEAAIGLVGVPAPAAVLQPAAQDAAAGPTRQQQTQSVEMPGVRKSAIVQQIGQAGRQCPTRLRHQFATDRQLRKEISQRQCQLARQKLLDQGLVIRAPAAGAATSASAAARSRWANNFHQASAGSTAASLGKLRHHAKADRASRQLPPAAGRIVEPLLQDLACPTTAPRGKMRQEKCGDLGRG